MEQYAKEHGFTNLIHFTDDGISGTRFDRPGFLAMMKEVESGKVGTILIKDMSRMGRDYLKVGQYMELLRQKNVRLIAVNENADSFREDDDFTPFRNIMNVVRYHFNEDAKETMQEKINRMLVTEASRMEV